MDLDSISFPARESQFKTTGLASLAQHNTELQEWECRGSKA